MSDPPPRPPASPLFPPHLRHDSRRGPFGRYAVGDTISMIGTWMQTMAQGWVMTGLTTSALCARHWSSSPARADARAEHVRRHVADKYDKRRIIVITNVVQIVLAVAVGWLVMTGRIHIWHILTAAVLLGISAAFEMPAASALVPELVDKENIATAIAVDRSIFHGTRLIGPALAGWLIGAAGSGLGVLRQCGELPGHDRGHCLHRAPRARHGRGGRTTRHRRHEGGHRLRRGRTGRRWPCSALMASNALCDFPVHGGDDAALRAGTRCTWTPHTRAG